ncbi:MAG: hypothetical protein A3E37_01145 [Candidatus Andersenbacteria bacterium RIFCSPHIGHO2_12_FULL_46_9]|nr:MAG: hypothetical protein A3E37_01145 [Candidatus Andersenbacteria bacterium RIFCSPHIGHO2_12_FULL_46_9]
MLQLLIGWNLIRWVEFSRFLDRDHPSVALANIGLWSFLFTTKPAQRLAGGLLRRPAQRSTGFNTATPCANTK